MLKKPIVHFSVRLITRCELRDHDLVLVARRGYTSPGCPGHVGYCQFFMTSGAELDQIIGSTTHRQNRERALINKVRVV
jgi:hypothetical protein